MRIVASSGDWEEGGGHKEAHRKILGSGSILSGCVVISWGYTNVIICPI